MYVHMICTYTHTHTHTHAHTHTHTHTHVCVCKHILKFLLHYQDEGSLHTAMGYSGSLLYISRRLIHNTQKKRDEDSVSIPLHSVSTPLHSVSIPLHSVSTPLDSVSTPLDSVSTPLHSVSTPLHSVSIPLHRAGSLLYSSWRYYHVTHRRREMRTCDTQTSGNPCRNSISGLFLSPPAT